MPDRPNPKQRYKETECCVNRFHFVSSSVSMIDITIPQTCGQFLLAQHSCVVEDDSAISNRPRFMRSVRVPGPYLKPRLPYGPPTRSPTWCGQPSHIPMPAWAVFPHPQSRPHHHNLWLTPPPPHHPTPRGPSPEPAGRCSDTMPFCRSVIFPSYGSIFPEKYVEI